MSLTGLHSDEINSLTRARTLLCFGKYRHPLRRVLLVDGGEVVRLVLADRAGQVEARWILLVLDDLEVFCHQAALLLQLLQKTKKQ
jgi:hypothetical protein